MNYEVQADGSGYESPSVKLLKNIEKIRAIDSEMVKQRYGNVTAHMLSEIQCSKNPNSTISRYCTNQDFVSKINQLIK